MKDVEQWLHATDSLQSDNKVQQKDGTSSAFDEFIQKRASTIPNEPVSEQQVEVTVLDPSTQNESNKANTHSINN